METIELIGYVVVLGIAFSLIIYGLLKLRGTGLLKRGRYPDPPEIEDDDCWEFPPELDINTTKPSTTDYDFVHFPKNKEDDLE